MQVPTGSQQGLMTRQIILLHPQKPILQKQSISQSCPHAGQDTKGFNNYPARTIGKLYQYNTVTGMMGEAK